MRPNGFLSFVPKHRAELGWHVPELAKGVDSIHHALLKLRDVPPTFLRGAGSDSGDANWPLTPSSSPRSTGVRGACRALVGGRSQRQDYRLLSPSLTRRVSKDSLFMSPSLTLRVGKGGLLMFALLALVITAGSCLAADPPLKADQLAIDVVTLKSGSTYRGAVLGRSADGTVQMAVQREWLQRQSPPEAERLGQQQNQQSQRAWQELSERLQDWLKEQPTSKNLIALLEIELERVNALLKSLRGEGRPIPPTQFLVVTFPEAQVKTSFVQNQVTRKWAALAWQRELKDVERRSLEDLRKELVGLAVTADDAVSLGNRLPVQAQSKEEWQARRALVEYRHGDRLEFQGMGNTWVRTDGNAAKPDLKLLLPSLLEQQLTSQLGDLLGEKPANKTPATATLNKAIEQAEAAGVKAFRATELKLDRERFKATVTNRLVIKLENGRWQTVWQQSLEEDGSKARPEMERRIEADPQVKEIMSVLKGLDLGGNGTNPATAAIRVGAAVMSAQQAAQANFQTFIEQYTQKLDGPPLSW